MLRRLQSTFDLKLVLALIALCVAYVTVTAQTVATYSFAQGSAVYTPITGGTVIAAALTADQAGNDSMAMDDYTYVNRPLAFPFTFNGTSYTTFNTNSNGWICFGGTSTATTSTPISATTAFGGVISAFATDLQGQYYSAGDVTLGSAVITNVANTSFCKVGALFKAGTNFPATTTIVSFTANSITVTDPATASAAAGVITWTTGEIRAEAIGVAPNRTFVIQFTGTNEYAVANTWVEFQIRLNEGGGIAANQTIDIVYGNVFRAAGTETTQVGLRGATNADYNNRTTTTNWAATTAGTANNSTNSWTTTSFPASGLTFSWAPPMPCVTPSAQPTALNLLAGSSTINASFTAASPVSDKYLVVRSTSPTLSASPVNGTAYALNATLGGGTVVGNTSATSIVASGLTPNTTYYFTVFAYNDLCSGGPLYNTTTPLTGSTATGVAQAYTWNLATGSGDALVPSNWTPARNVPDATDTLYFNNGGTSTITNLQTSTVAKIAIQNNTSITANSGATAVITIAKQFLLDAGSTLDLSGANGLTINFSATGAPQTATIAGTLNMSGTGTSLYAAANSVTTVTGTGTINVSNTGSMTGALATLFFNAGSNYNHSRNGGSFPVAAYNAASTINVTGVTTTLITPPAKMGSVVWNCPAQTVVNSWGSSVDTIYGNLTIISTGTGAGKVEGGNNPDIQVMGTFTQTGGTFAVGNYTSGVGLVDVFGAVNLNGGTLLLNSNTAGGATYTFRANSSFTQLPGHIVDRLNSVAGTVNTITFAGTSPIAVNIGGAVSNNISYALNNPAGGVLTGILPVNLNAINTITNGAWSGTGSFTYNGATTSLAYNGANAQTTTGFEFPASAGPTNLVINNTSTAGVTLHAPRTLPGAFTLTAGKLNTSLANLLTLSATVATVPAGSATSYVNGPLAIEVNSAANLNRAFAIGDAGGFRPLILNNFHTGGVLQTYVGRVITGGTGGTGAGINLNSTRYFQLSNLSTIQSTTTPTVTLGYGADDIIGAVATAVVGQSATANGVYANRGQSANTATTVTSSTATPITAAGGEFFVLANTASLPKSWDGGAATSNWSDAANWSPDGVPVCTDDIILAGTGLVINLPAAGQCQNLTIGNGVTLNAPAGSLLTAGCATPSGGNSVITVASGGTLNITAGTVHVNGGITLQSGSTFNQSGGLLEIDPNDGTAAGSLISSSAFNSLTLNLNCSAGIIRIIDPLYTTNTNYALTTSVSTTANTYFTGTHTVEIGDGISTTQGGANGFRLYSFLGAGYAPYNNMVIKGGSAPGRWAFHGGALVVNGTLTINSGSSLRSTSTLYLGGNFVNNGLYASTGTVTFGPPSTFTVTNPQAVSGSGVFRNTIPAQTSITAAGTGYAVGDIITLSGGTFSSPATFMVNAVNGTGGITTLTVHDMGTYTVVPTSPVSVTGGTGTGATLTFAAAASPAPAGYLIPSGQFTSITLNNTGVGSGVTFNIGDFSYKSTLTFTKGNIFMGANTLIQLAGASVSGPAQTTGWIVGKMQKNATAGALNHTYTIGDANYYTPVVIAGAAGSVLTAGDIIVSTTTGDHPAIGYAQLNPSKSINRYYTAQAVNGITFNPGSLTMTLNWNAADVDAGVVVANLAAAQNTGGNTWVNATVAAPAATSIQLTGLGASINGSYQVAEFQLVPLSVQLVSFTGVVKNNVNTLEWKTASETNNSGFELQRSADGESYNKVVFIPSKANGNSATELSYEHPDGTAPVGMSYYRLKQIDLSGKFSYSNVVMLSRRGDAVRAGSVYPNPATTAISMDITSQQSQLVSYSIMDLAGKVVLSGNAGIEKGETRLNWNVSGLAPGSYIVTLTDSEGTAISKFIKK